MMGLAAQPRDCGRAHVLKIAMAITMGYMLILML